MNPNPAYLPILSYLPLPLQLHPQTKPCLKQNPKPKKTQKNKKGQNKQTIAKKEKTLLVEVVEWPSESHRGDIAPW